MVPLISASLFDLELFFNLFDGAVSVVLGILAPNFAIRLSD